MKVYTSPDSFSWSTSTGIDGNCGVDVNTVDFLQFMNRAVSHNTAYL